MKRIHILLLLLFSTWIPLQGVVRLPAIFSDHMVLQDGKPVKLWGWASPGENMTIEFAGQFATLRANLGGVWRTTFDPPGKRGPHKMVITGRNRIIIEDILMGEVWVCSGQSNMEWPLTRTMNASREIATAEYPEIRLFKVERHATGVPQENCRGSWKPCNPQNTKSFSAVAYFFGRHLHKELGVPIGLIQSAWGGTPIEAWTSREALLKVEEAMPIIKRWNLHASNFKQNKTSHVARIAEWEMASARARAAGKDIPARPRIPKDPAMRSSFPGSLYNGMIQPLIPFAIRGVIWYQGESNVSRAHQYGAIFPAQIRDWREKWGLGDFPFLFVQVAPFRYSRYHREMCAELWEAQLNTLRSVSGTGMAVTTDIGDIRNIHPGNKQDVGKRLALWALHDAYGKKEVQPSGPLYIKHEIKGEQMILSFEHVGRGLASLNKKPLTHFTLAGKDRVFHMAEAFIRDNQIVVQSRRVLKPAATRFAWRDDAQPNFGNLNGLPASPFRTDKWPGKTSNNR